MTGWQLFSMLCLALLPYVLLAVLAALLAWGLWLTWRFSRDA